MFNFVRIIKIIGRAIRRAACAVGRFFKFTFKKIGKSIKTNKQKKRITKNTKAIEKLYYEIGQNYYEAHCDAPEELLSELCADVSENKTSIDEAEATITALRESYDTARAEAKAKAKARREADKAAAKADKAKANGEEIGIPEEPVIEAAPAVDPVYTAPVVPEPEPVVVAPAAPEPEPVIETPVVPEPEPVIEEPEPAPEPETVFEAPAAPAEEREAAPAPEAPAETEETTPAV